MTKQPEAILTVINAVDLKIGDIIVLFTNKGGSIYPKLGVDTVQNPNLNEESIVGTITDITKKNEIENLVIFQFLINGGSYTSNFYASLNSKNGITLVVKLTIKYAHFLDTHSS